jgi:hypothetical protein
MRVALTFAPAALAACSSGCGPIWYEPRAPVSAEAAGARVSVTEIEAPGGEVRYRTELEAAPDTVLHGAELRPRYSKHELSAGPDSDCTTDTRASFFELDGKRQRLPFSVSGSHEVTITVPLWDQYCVPERLDLQLGREGSNPRVKVPLDIPERWGVVNPFAMSVGSEALFTSTPVTGVLALAAFPLGINHWVGPFRFGAVALGIGFAICDESVCPRDGSGRSAGLVIPLGLSVTWYQWVDDPLAENPRGPFAFGWELRLREYLSFIPEYGDTELRAMHSPQGVFHFSVSSGQAPHGLPAGPRLGAFDLEIAAGALVARDAGETDVALVFGGGFGVHFWL